MPDSKNINSRLITALLLVVIIISIMCFAGCSKSQKKENNQEAIQQTDKAESSKPEEKNIQKPYNTSNNAQHKSDSKIEEIKSKLNKDTYGIAVSFDNNYVAYVQGDTQLLEGQLFLWKVEDNSPKLIDGVKDRICKLYWSPDSQYIFVDIGTSAQRAGIIVSTKDNKALYGIAYTGGPIWSPDSKYVAVGMVSKIQPITPTELDGVQDMVLFNIQTREKKIIAQATSEYDFIPREWDKDGTLHYDKHYYVDKPIERLTYLYK